jgi:antitoxin component of MazEF toxin-antitoxin module
VRYELDDLLSQIREENLHDEIGTGQPAGREAW